MNQDMLRERITNILKRMTFKYHSIVDIDNTNPYFVSTEVRNDVTGGSSIIQFPYDMLNRWYGYNNLKYDLVKEYLISSMIDDDYTESELW